MAVSTIFRQHRDARLALAIGQELRGRRLEAGLTQAALARPFTRGFVSAVERGRAVPSIPALALLLGRLGVRFDEFFGGVQSRMTVRYTPGNGDRSEAPPGRRR